MTALFEVRRKAKPILKGVTDCFVKEEKYFWGKNSKRSLMKLQNLKEQRKALRPWSTFGLLTH